MIRNAKRYLVFTFTMVLSGLCMAMMTYPNVGTGTVNSLPYEVSLYTFLSVGQANFALNVLFVASQYLLVSAAVRNTRANLISLLVQIPTVLLFSVSIDAGMLILNWMFGPQMDSYIARLAMAVIGILVLTVSISLQLIVSVALVPSDAFVRVVADRVGKGFGLIKLILDVSVVVLAVLYGLWQSDCQRVISVREGTVIAALLLGPVVAFVRPRLAPVESYINKDAW